MCVRLASLVGITERETGVGKLGWHGNSTGFDRKNIVFFPILRNERKEKDKLTSSSTQRHGNIHVAFS